MSTEKIKFALRITPETQKLVKDLCPRDNCQSQNEFIDKAIRFYAGYLSAKDAVEVLPPALVAALKGTVQDSEGRIARLLFKLAVELDRASWTSVKAPCKVSGSGASGRCGRREATSPSWTRCATRRKGNARCHGLS